MWIRQPETSGYYLLCTIRTPSGAPFHIDVGIFHDITELYIYLVSVKLKTMLVTIFNLIGLPLHYQ